MRAARVPRGSRAGPTRVLHGPHVWVFKILVGGGQRDGDPGMCAGMRQQAGVSLSVAVSVLAQMGSGAGGVNLAWVGAERSVQKQKRSWSTQKQMRWAKLQHGRACDGGQECKAGVLEASVAKQANVGCAQQKHQWSSGRIHRCHRCDPGSIPG